MAEIPQSYDPAKAEREWAERWERDGIYRWDPTRPRAETFAVDTPPLTVSGSLHIGHAFSFMQADVIVRCQRMTGKNTFEDQFRRHARGNAQENNSTVAAGRVQQRVSEFGIQCDETALLADAALDHIAVQRPFHLLIGYGEDIEASLE